MLDNRNNDISDISSVINRQHATQFILISNVYNLSLNSSAEKC